MPQNPALGELVGCLASKPGARWWSPALLGLAVVMGVLSFPPLIPSAHAIFTTFGDAQADDNHDHLAPFQGTGSDFIALSAVDPGSFGGPGLLYTAAATGTGGAGGFSGQAFASIDCGGAVCSPSFPAIAALRMTYLDTVLIVSTGEQAGSLRGLIGLSGSVFGAQASAGAGFSYGGIICNAPQPTQGVQSCPDLNVIPGQTVVVAFSLFLDVQQFGVGASFADASHTATFFLDTSPGLSYTTDSGHTYFSSPAAAVPEPGTLTLVGSGLAGLAGLAWRRHRRM